jgi:drug/metabolite transporter (DMT)-like permease
MFFASLALVIVALIIKLKLPEKKDIIWFVLAGFSGFFFYMFAFNIGSVTVTASTDSIIVATTPVFTMIFARLFYKEKIKVLQYIAMVIEFIGVGVLTLMNGIFSINFGVLLLLLASISLSLYNLLQRSLTKKYSSIQAVVLSIWFGTLMLTVFAPNAVEQIRTAPFIQFVYLFIMGVFCSALAFITWSQAFKKAANTSSVTNYMFITPLLTTLLGMLLAKEVPDTSTIVGGSIILIGMFIYNFSEKLFFTQRN